MSDPVKRNCLNCGVSYTEGEVYCGNCGQKTSEPKLSVRALIANFFSNVFNLDSKFFSSIRSLIIPGKISVDYVAGSRVKYFSPGRILFVSMFIFLFLFANVIAEVTKDNNWDRWTKLSWQKTQAQKFDSIVKDYRIKYQDSLIILDSLKQDLFIGPDTNSILTFSGGLADTSSSEVDISLLNTPLETYFKEKNITDPSQQLFYSRVKKVLTDPKGSLNMIIGNLIWIVFLMSLSTAAVMKLLYIRGRYFFAEHVIFQMHYLAFGLILGSIFLIITWIQDEFIAPVFWTFTMGAGLYLLLALKNYFKQGYFKTIIKFLVIVFSYMFSFTTFALLVVVVSLLLF